MIAYPSNMKSKRRRKSPGGAKFYKRSGLKAITFFVRPEVHSKLRVFADREDRSMQATLQRILEAFFKTASLVLVLGWWGCAAAGPKPESLIGRTPKELVTALGMPDRQLTIENDGETVYEYSRCVVGVVPIQGMAFAAGKQKCRHTDYHIKDGKVESVTRRRT